MAKSVAGMIGIEAWKDWQAKGQPAQLVDVRSVAEFAMAHLPSAANIPLEQIEQRIGDITASTPVVLVCQAGTRALMAQVRLAARGRDSLVLEGGTDAWIKAGLPVVRLTTARWALERQVRLIAGLLVAVGVLLGVVASRWWLIVPGFVGCGLTFAGITGFCPMGEVLARLPWNRPRKATAATLPAGISCSCQLKDRQ